jgi:hypothetical protein
LSSAGLATAQWRGGPPFEPDESRLRLSLCGGGYRISHSEFEQYYSSRWGLVPSLFVRGKVKGVGLLFGVREFRKGLNRKTAAEYGDAGSAAWRQTVWNLGVQLGGGGMRRVRSATYFGLCYHVVRELVGPLVLDRSRSTTLGFFLLAETEWLIRPRLGLGWMIELSSAAPARSAAFEANSIGGLYLAAGVHFHAL